MRDKETDQQLLQLRRLFNEDDLVGVVRHSLLMADWLYERGREEEAEHLRKGHWLLLILEGQGWPPPCIITGKYVPGTSRNTYMCSDWITDRWEDISAADARSFEEEEYRRELLNKYRVKEEEL